MKFVSYLISAVVLLTGVALGQDKVLMDLLEKIKQQESRANSVVTDMTVTQKMTTFGKDGAAAMEAGGVMYMKGDKLRMEMNASMSGNDTSESGQAAADIMQAMGTTVTIFDGENMHVQMPMLGWQSFPPESKEAQQTQGQRSWTVWITGDIRLVGTEEIDGVTCVMLTLDKNQYTPYDKIWVDRERLVPLKAKALDPNAAPLTLRYYDYHREAEGLYYPYRTEILNNGRLVTRMTVSDVKINTGLDDALFVPGKGGTALAGLFGAAANTEPAENDSSAEEKQRSSGCCCLIGGDGGEGFWDMLDMFLDMIFGGF